MLHDMAEAKQPALPTYRTAARVLEGDKGSGVRLAAWTVARTIMIAPPMMLVGVPARQAFIGAAIASSLMSVFVVLRIFDARHTGLAGINRRRALGSPRRAATRRR
jgi:hypothetical protein